MIGEVACWLALSSLIYKVHNVFHVSMLRKYMTHPSHILNWEEDTIFMERPMEIQDHGEMKIRGKTIKLVRILWPHRGIEELNMGEADAMKANYLHVFPSKGTL